MMSEYWKELNHAFLKHVHKHRAISAALLILGGFTVLKTAFKVVRGTWTTFLRPSRNHFKRYHGGYVVVTGATNGIGLEYCRQFAKKGFNLVLISRDEGKLSSTKEELLKTNDKIDIITISFDFNQPYTDEGYAPLKEKLLQLKDVSILVNNVGVNTYGPISGAKMKDLNSMIQINWVSQAFMSNTLIPGMLKRSKEEGKRCAIIDVSSVLNYVHLINSGVYCATKSFNYTLSSVIRKEVGDYIDVLTVLPGPTLTNMIRFKGLVIVDPDKHVKWALKDLGYNKETYGHYVHLFYRNAYRLPLFETGFACWRDKKIQELVKAKTNK